jgi:uncharacterized delta-60 repeat protein
MNRYLQVLGAAAVWLGLMVLALPMAEAHPGGLDRSFGEDGHRMIVLPGESAPSGLHLHSDGTIVALLRAGTGPSSGNSLFRVDSEGVRHHAIGTGSVMPPTYVGNGFGDGFGETAGGVIVPGTTHDAQYNWSSAVTKLGPDFLPDSTFGQTGEASVDFGGTIDSFSDVVALPDGSIVAAGASAEGYDGLAGHLARLTPSGTLDPTFMGTGKVSPHDMAEPKLIAGPDGRVLLLADERGCVRLGDDCNVPRLIYGLSFGAGPVAPDDGKVVFDPPIGYRAHVSDAIVLAGGGVLVVGTLQRAGSRASKLLTISLSPTLDMTDWRAIRNAPAGSRIAGVDPQGRALLASPTSRGNQRQVTLTRLARSGMKLDRSFGADGRVTIPVGSWSYAATARSDGNTLVLTTDFKHAGVLVLSRYLGGDDRDKPEVTIRVARSRCLHGRRIVRIIVRDSSSLANVSIRIGGRVVATTTKRRTALKVRARAETASSRTIGVVARDTAGNRSFRHHVLSRCA